MSRRTPPWALLDLSRRLGLGLCLGLAFPPLAGATGTDEDRPGDNAEDAPGTQELRPEDRLPDDPEVERGKAAYNAGRYQEASRIFLALAQRHPQVPALYRALARSRTWAGALADAVIAYRIYLAVAPDAADRDKVKAELDLALRKVPTPPGEPPGGDALTAAVSYAESGVFAGENAAFGQLDAALSAGYIGPRLAEVRARIADALSSQSRDAVDRWWRLDAQVEPTQLSRLEAGWRALQPRRAATAAESGLASALTGLRLLAAGDWPGAAAALQPAAPGDHRLRFAQALALTRAGQDEDAAALLEALARHHAEPRILLLRGLVLNRLGRTEEGVAALRAALLD